MRFPPRAGVDRAELAAQRARSRATVSLAIALLVVAGCAVSPPPALAPVAPERARAELAAARTESAARPGQPEVLLRLGRALYQAGDDDAARETLAELMDEPGGMGARAALYHAAASERREDWSAARRGYSRFLAHRRHREVELRLRQVSQKEAEAAVRRAIALELSLDPARFPEWSITVPPLRVASADSSLEPLGYGLADLVATDLARIGRLEVVERTHLNALLRELELGASDRADAAAAPRLGRLLGARRVVHGTLTALPRERLRIDANVSDVATANVSETPASASSLEDIFDAQKRLTLRILETLGITPTPAERAAIEQRPTTNLAALLAYSRGVRDEAHGRVERAVDEYSRALAVDRGFELARIRLRDAGGQDAAATRPAGRGSYALVNRVNPSPAARLSAVRAQADEIGSLLDSAESAIVVIPIVIIPNP